MKKTIKRIIVICIVVIAIIIGVLLLIKSLNNKNKLTVDERNWINNSTQGVLNINVVNDSGVFGLNGTGVFYDFLNDFAKEYSLNINPITYNSTEPIQPLSFAKKSSVDDNDVVFYADHFVVVAKNPLIMNSIKEINGKTVGVSSLDADTIRGYFDGGINITPYETKDALSLALLNDEVSYIVVPLDYYLPEILRNNYEIIYHLSDIKYYYSLVLNDSMFSRVLRKYYNTWKNFDKYYNEEEFAIFKDNLSISDSEVESIKREVLKYGFVNTSPFEVIKGSTFGGINAVALKKFSDFSKAEFSFSKYGNFSKFVSAINNNEIDLYFNRYNIENSWASTTNALNISYDIVARRNNSITINSLKSLKDQTIYVEENSLLYNFLTGVPGVKIATYSSEKELLKLNKKNVLIILDSNIYNYYANTKLNNYTSRYQGFINGSYNFKINNNAVLTKLLNKYLSTLDKQVLVNEGLENHYNTMRTGIILSTIAKYVIYILLLAAVIVL